MVDKVEVVPNPSARENPEGDAGIINIVLKRRADAGTSGGITLGGGTTGRADIGGNVGYYYQTNTIAILPGQDVRIEAKVRTTQLVQARALLEVSFNDARGEVIPASRRRRSRISLGGLD
jgi:hypothetical protein